MGQGTLGEEDLYMRLKELQRQMEFLDISEEYIKDEMKNLKREMIRAQEEIKRVQSVPLVIGQFSEMVDQNRGIVSSTAGSNYFVRILSTLNRELLKPSSSVALHRHSHAVVDILPPEADSTVQSLTMGEKPDVTYADIGGRHPEAGDQGGGGASIDTNGTLFANRYRCSKRCSALGTSR